MTDTILAQADTNLYSNSVTSIIDLVKRESPVVWIMALRDSLQRNATQYYINYGLDTTCKSFWLKRIHETNRIYFYLQKYVCGVTRQKYNEECMLVLHDACYYALQYLEKNSTAYERVFQLFTKQNTQLEPYYKSIENRQEA